jgi:hypothetical protein
MSQVPDRDYSCPVELLDRIKRARPGPLRVDTFLIDRNGDHKPADPASSLAWIDEPFD